MDLNSSNGGRFVKPSFRTMCCNVFVGLLIALISAANFGCAPSPSSGWGFTLPEGNVERGQAAFTRMHCNACHSVAGIEQLAPIIDGADPEVSVSLGGEVNRVKTYGELVTAVINPSHRLAAGYKKDAVATDEGKSKMPIYNEMMTVQELTDIVTFLQTKYELKPYEPSYYPIY